MKGKIVRKHIAFRITAVVIFLSLIFASAVGAFVKTDENDNENNCDDEDDDR